MAIAVSAVTHLDRFSVTPGRQGQVAAVVSAAVACPTGPTVAATAHTSSTAGFGSAVAGSVASAAAASQSLVLGAALPETSMSAIITEAERIDGLITPQALTILRTYVNGTETVCPSHAPFLPFRSQLPDPASVINGSMDSLLTSWFQSIPAGGYCTIHHEADAPKKGISPATFDAMINHAGALCHSVAPGVHFGPVMMEYQMRVQYPNYTYCQTIDAANIDFWGFDTYSGMGRLGTVQQCCEDYAMPYFSALDASLPFMVAELGDVNTQPDLPQWLYDGLVWAAGANTTCLYYNLTGGGEWSFTDAQLSQFGALVAGG